MVICRSFLTNCIWSDLTHTATAEVDASYGGSCVHLIEVEGGWITAQPCLTRANLGIRLKATLLFPRTSEFDGKEFASPDRRTPSTIFIIGCHGCPSSLENNNNFNLSITPKISSKSLSIFSYRQCWYNQFAQSHLSTLAILEHKDKTFLPASLSALTAATKLGEGGQVTALLTGSDAQSLSSKAAKLAGVNKVWIVPNKAYDHFLPENYAPLIAEAAKKGEFTHVIAAHGQFGKNTIPRVGALLDVQPIADIIKIKSDDTFVRQIYAGISL